MLIKAFRLFVSSTFADFAAERDVLQREVFPALDGYCAAKGYQFYPLDLRWGVNEEAQLDQRTAEICLNEVRATKADYPPPNFLIMIGNRYGFVPLPYAIAQDEFEAIVAWLEGRGRQDDVRALGSVYQHDGNHLVPRGLSDAGPDDVLNGAYTLRSRVDELPELRSAEPWAEHEAELRAALQEAADGLLTLGQISAAAHEKYFLSLTDQEIIHGLPGYRPVVDQVSPSSPVTDGPPAIAVIREIVTDSSIVPDHFFGQGPRLDALKDAIRRVVPEDHIVTARATIDENGRLDGRYLADFAARIQDKLKFAIDQHIARVEATERAPDYALTSERAAHRAFGEQKLKIFVGRERELAATARYLAGADDGQRPLVLHGRSGLGKSALMARAIALAEAPGRAPVVARFIGASAASSNPRALLVSLVEDLAAHGIVTVSGEFEQDAIKFNAQIAALLSSITSPAVVFLDALDQLQKPHDLGWLPAKLPEALKLVVSVLHDAAYEADSGLYRDLRNRLEPDAFLQIESLGLPQGREILCALEQQTRHRLQDGQRDYIIGKFEQAEGSPLYLRTAFEIARSWKSYHNAGAGRFVLAEGTAGVIAQLIAELSSVQHHEPELVTRTLGYLAAAKDGLSAKELTDVLSRDAGVMQAISSERFGAQADKLPPSLWVRLNRDLSPFLVEKQIDEQPLLQFFHRQVAQVARRQYYEPVKVLLHAALVTYFESLAVAQDSRRIYTRRSLSELPYQLHHANNSLRLGEILMSPAWMRQKLNACGIRALIGDYKYTSGKAPTLVGQVLELVEQALSRDPRQLEAQLVNRLSGAFVNDPTESAALDSLLSEARVLIMPPALIARWPSLAAADGAEVRRFEGHAPLNSVAFSPDGRHIVSGAGQRMRDGTDNALRLWDLGTGREVHRFEGHGQRVNAVAYCSDGLQIVSCSADKTVRLWNTATGRCRTFEGHDDEVTAFAISPSGRYIVSASLDKRSLIWEIATGKGGSSAGPGSAALAIAIYWDKNDELLPESIAFGLRGGSLYLRGIHVRRIHRRTVYLSGHTDDLTSACFSPDGKKIVSGSKDKTIRVWEVATQHCRRFRGHTGEVTAVAFSPDGRHIASASSDHTVRLWGAESGRSLCFKGHGHTVSSVAFSPDGKHIASASQDQTVRIWRADVEGLVGTSRNAGGIFQRRTTEDNRSHRIEAHSDSVTAVVISPDARHILSSSIDKTRRWWDPKTGSSRRLSDHTSFQHPAENAYERIPRLWEKCANVISHCLDPSRIFRFGPFISKPTRRIAQLWEKFAPCFSTLIAVSPNGQYLINDHFALFDVASGNQVSALRVSDGETVLAISFSPDGGYVLTGHGTRSGIRDQYHCSDYSVRLWDIPSCGWAGVFLGHTDNVYSVAMSADRRFIVSGSGDKTLRLWDVTNKRTIACMTGHTDMVFGVTFTSDGRHIISGSRDRTLRMWEVAGEREVARFDCDNALHQIAIFPDRKRVVGGDREGRLHLFDILADEADKRSWLEELATFG
jgi:WD40 repeat protein